MTRCSDANAELHVHLIGDECTSVWSSRCDSVQRSGRLCTVWHHSQSNIRYQVVHATEWSSARISVYLQWWPSDADLSINRLEPFVQLTRAKRHFFLQQTTCLERRRIIYGIYREYRRNRLDMKKQPYFCSEKTDDGSNDLNRLVWYHRYMQGEEVTNQWRGALPNVVYRYGGDLLNASWARKKVWKWEGNKSCSIFLG